MAHPDPKLAESNRNMAHKTRKRLGLPGRIFGSIGSGFLALVKSPASAPEAIKRSLPREPKRREFGLMLALVIAACAISAGIPVMAVNGHSGTTPTPTASPSLLAAATESPTPTPTESPSPTPTATPTDSPTPTPSATGTATPTPTAKPTAAATKKHRVYPYVALGDSLTAWPSDNPWPRLLDTRDPYLTLYHNSGIPGDTTADMRARLNSDVFSYKPNYVFVLGGTNDLGHNISAATTIANLRYIVTQSLQRHIQPILILVPPDSYSGMAPKIDALNAAIVHLANSYRIVAIDVHTPLSTSTGTIQSRYTSDGLHFSSLGAQVVANAIYNRVRRLGL